MYIPREQLYLQRKSIIDQPALALSDTARSQPLPVGAIRLV
jgi:hypothetical protein